MITPNPDLTRVEEKDLVLFISGISRTISLIRQCNKDEVLCCSTYPTSSTLLVKASELQAKKRKEKSHKSMNTIGWCHKKVDGVLTLHTVCCICLQCIEDGIH